WPIRRDVCTRARTQPWRTGTRSAPAGSRRRTRARPSDRLRQADGHGTDRLVSYVSLIGQHVLHLGVQLISDLIEDRQVTGLPDGAMMAREVFARGILDQPRPTARARRGPVQGFKDTFVDGDRCLDSHTTYPTTSVDKGSGQPWRSSERVESKSNRTSAGD